MGLFFSSRDSVLLYEPETDIHAVVQMWRLKRYYFTVYFFFFVFFICPMQGHVKDFHVNELNQPFFFIILNFNNKM